MMCPVLQMRHQGAQFPSPQCGPLHVQELRPAQHEVLRYSNLCQTWALKSHPSPKDFSAKPAFTVSEENLIPAGTGHWSKTPCEHINLVHIPLLYRHTFWGYCQDLSVEITQNLHCIYDDLWTVASQLMWNPCCPHKYNTQPMYGTIRDGLSASPKYQCSFVFLEGLLSMYVSLK